MAYVTSLVNRVRFWYYRRKHHIPHPNEINPFLVRPPHLRELAKLYWAGFTLEQCAQAIEAMKMPDRDPPIEPGKPKLPARNFQARMFFGRRHTRERLRQLIWKIWRDQRVVRDSR